MASNKHQGHGMLEWMHTFKVQRLDFTKSSADPNQYFNFVKGEPIIILLYVVDLLLIGLEGRIEQCKKQLSTKFDMKALGLMHYYLGLDVWQESDEIYLGQGKYVIKMLKRFDMMDCKPMTNLMIIALEETKKFRIKPYGSVDGAGPANIQGIFPV